MDIGRIRRRNCQNGDLYFQGMMVLSTMKILCHALRKTAKTFHTFKLFLISLIPIQTNLMLQKFMPKVFHKIQCSLLTLVFVSMKRFLQFGKVVVLAFTGEGPNLPGCQAQVKASVFAECQSDNTPCNDCMEESPCKECQYWPIYPCYSAL